MYVSITEIVDCNTAFRMELLGHEKMSDPHQARRLLITLSRRLLQEGANNVLSADTMLVYLSFCSLPVVSDLLEGPLFDFLTTLRSRVREMRANVPYFCGKFDVLVAKGCIGDIFVESQVPADKNLLIVV